MVRDSDHNVVQLSGQSPGLEHALSSIRLAVSALERSWAFCSVVVSLYSSAILLSSFLAMRHNSR